MKASMPGEWSPHAAIWTAWPVLAEEWGGDLASVRAEMVSFVEALAEAGERVRVLVRPELRAQAHAALGDTAELVEGPYGDIWLRDTGPLFVETQDGLGSVRFRFNAWGEKYPMPGDEAVAEFIQKYVGGPATAIDFVLEGGAIDVDGEGSLLTTRQCLLEPRRNPGYAPADIESVLAETLGARKVLWLDQGLLNDHTDGHVDTLARFVCPGVVVCMTPAPDDPNRVALEAIERTLASMEDATGRTLKVRTVPSPGAVESPDGELLPASYLNFVIANEGVVMPAYGVSADDAAAEALQELFPERRVLSRPARAILQGGGAFHCITQQQPRDVAP